MKFGTLNDALKEGRHSRSQLYRDLSASNIKAVKRGRSVLAGDHSDGIPYHRQI
jgi:hypothetical protein